MSATEDRLEMAEKIWANRFPPTRRFLVSEQFIEGMEYAACLLVSAPDANALYSMLKEAFPDVY